MSHSQFITHCGGALNRTSRLLSGRHREMLIISPIDPERWDLHVFKIGGPVEKLVYDLRIAAGLDRQSLIPIRVRKEATPIDRYGKLKPVIHAHDCARERSTPTDTGDPRLVWIHLRKGSNKRMGQDRLGHCMIVPLIPNRIVIVLKDP